VGHFRKQQERDDGRRCNGELRPARQACAVARKSQRNKTENEVCAKYVQRGLAKRGQRLRERTHQWLDPHALQDGAKPQRQRDDRCEIDEPEAGQVPLIKKHGVMSQVQP